MSYVGSRFGQDGPPRIATTAEMLLEATEMPPIPNYQPLVPFYPSVIAGSTGSSVSPAGVTTTEINSWERSPARCDLQFYQGDDVIVTLYIQDPSNPNTDMSDQSQWMWHSQIRLWHNYRSRLVSEFIVDSSYVPPSPPDIPLGITKIELLLPRQENNVYGTYHWDLYSESPYSYTNFIKPDDWEGEWPPEDGIRTWLYGEVKILPRVTSTDSLPVPPVLPPGGPVVQGVAVFAGPNGRVP